MIDKLTISGLRLPTLAGGFRVDTRGRNGHGGLSLSAPLILSSYVGDYSTATFYSELSSYKQKDVLNLLFRRFPRIFWELYGDAQPNTHEGSQHYVGKVSSQDVVI